MIFILGGNGFIGSAITRACQAAGMEHQIIDRKNYASKIGARCDVFVNAAGNSRKYFAAEKPIEDFDASVRSVRSSLVDFRYETYVLISSADVYPDSSSPMVTNEDQSLEPSRMTPYGFHKYLAELCVQHGARRWLILRGGGFVGPLMKKNAIYDILHGGPLWLDKESELQYIHTDQAASAVFHLLKSGIVNQVFNLSAKGVVRLSDVVQWAGGAVVVKENSPRIRCELNLDRISACMDLPNSSAVVRRFVESFAAHTNDCRGER